VRSETVGYVKKPSLKEKIHCVAFVVDASKVPTYPEGLGSSFQQLREHISDLGERSGSASSRRLVVAVETGCCALRPQVFTRWLC